MKKTIFSIMALAGMVTMATAQTQYPGRVGVNTSEPKATLDVAGKPADTSVTDGLIAPRITGNELAAKDALYTADQTGALVYATAAASPTTAKTINVTAAGYFYFDGTVWVAVPKPIPGGTGADATVDAWIDDSANTMVKLGTLSDGSTVRPAGTELVVKDAGRIGLGMTNPTNSIDVLAPTGQQAIMRLSGTFAGVRLDGDGTAGAGVNYSSVSLRDRNTNDFWSIFFGTPTNTTPGRSLIFGRTFGTSAVGMFIEPTNMFIKMGANTSLPTNKLHVVDTANPLRLEGLQAGAAADEILTADATGVVRKVSASSLAGTLGADATVDAWIDDSTNARVKLGTLSNGTTARPAGTEFVALDNGNVGIGTTAPIEKLNVVGNINAQGDIYADRISDNGNASLILASNNTKVSSIYGRKGGILSANTRWRMELGSAVSETGSNVGSDFRLARYSDTGTILDANALIMKRSNGKVSIGGLANPVAKLEVYESELTGTNHLMQRWITNAGGRIGIYNSDLSDPDPIWDFNVNTGEKLKITTGSDIGLFMDEKANVALGHTAPLSKLDVNGYVKLGSSDTIADQAVTNKIGMIRYNPTLDKFQGFVKDSDPITAGDQNGWVDLH